MLASATIAGLCGCTAPQSDVRQVGAMREVVRDGRTEPRIRVADAVSGPGTVAVGALAGLDGEITIVDGDVWVARVDGDDLHITGPAPNGTDQATLLTLADVTDWRSVVIDRAAAGSALETVIEQAARGQGIDTARPFAFVIDGRLDGLDVHVINGFCPAGTVRAEGSADPWRWTSATPLDATVVGFFAPDAAGVMTHHGTSIHAHAIATVDGRMITGHVDRMAVAPGARLRLPVARRP
ncbi:MAG: acetolactate decarboxylase [Planctomycetota bacterium]